MARARTAPPVARRRGARRRSLYARRGGRATLPPDEIDSGWREVADSWPCQAPRLTDSALGDARLVAVVQQQRVAVGIAEERHVADAGVEDVAGEGDAALLERGARRGHVAHLQRDVV